MLHNTEVSYVEMFVRDEQQVALVEQVVGAMIGDWAGSGCPRYTRPVIASIVVSPFPAGNNGAFPHHSATAATQLILPTSFVFILLAHGGGGAFFAR